MADGDLCARSSDWFGAIDTYRKAINLAPRASEPRLRLAQVMLQAGMRDQAISEVRRALTLDPDSKDARDFLTTLGLSPEPDIQISVTRAPGSTPPKELQSLLAQGDAAWNANQIPGALAAYKSAAEQDPSAVAPQARLARLYAAQENYALSLKALGIAGPEGYSYALEIIASQTENIVGEVDAAVQLYDKGETTREQYYVRLKAADKHAQGLADFVAKVTPPETNKLSHLHRQLSTRLLAQETASWIGFAETGEIRYKSEALTLEKEVVREMRTAASAENARTSDASP